MTGSLALSRQCWILSGHSGLVVTLALLVVSLVLSFGEGAVLGKYIGDGGYDDVDDLSDFIDGFVVPSASASENYRRQPSAQDVVPLAMKARTEIMQLYRAILGSAAAAGGATDGGKPFDDEELHSVSNPVKVTGASEARSKRPSDGLLGIDNLDFATSTLDKARSRVRLPMETQWMAHKISKQIYTQPSASTSQGSTGGGPLGGAGGMSMSLSVGDMRRMLDMMKHGR